MTEAPQEHEFIFEVTVAQKLGDYFEEEEYQDFAREGESREEFARRRVEEKAPRRLTMRIADDGIRIENVEVGELDEHLEY